MQHFRFNALVGELAGIQPLLCFADNGEGHTVGLRHFFLFVTPKLSFTLMFQDIGNKIDLLVAGELVRGPCRASGVRPLGAHGLWDEQFVSSASCRQEVREGGSPQPLRR